jgi:hypothetical protein
MNTATTANKREPPDGGYFNCEVIEYKLIQASLQEMGNLQYRKKTLEIIWMF